MNIRSTIFIALLAGSAVAAPAATPPAKSALPFIEDDYAKALAEARARHVPIFVDAWAPW